MMEKELFLIDANSLITPYLTFYPFDLVKTFWNQMGCISKMEISLSWTW